MTIEEMQSLINRLQGELSAMKKDKEKSDKDKDLKELKEQIAAMQKKLDQIGD